MGYDAQEEITGHGFRGDSSDHDLRTLGGEPDAIERHLAHTTDEELESSYDRAAFDRAAFIGQRKTMGQQRTCFLDEVEAGKMPQPEDTYGRSPAGARNKHDESDHKISLKWYIWHDR